ncbi:anti-sigma factor [Seonamhaeicola algicola]|uniref:Anti-sigma factor n=1 Tax=Seonamhaeicola algicola TaxID=1719036 RepID=A0A5C7AMM6_9FLAO|nr:anti-sigma factor [Seonamhaeicola algicola]TXE10000.1 anti-sigma factor [Seonamhaeicola algicola]
MDIKAYIESGILELYVAGTLSEKENKEVYALMQKHPEILQEVLEIESAVVKLTAATSAHNPKKTIQHLKQKLGFKNTKVVSIKPKYNWLTYTGWAAAVILGAGLLWTVNRNNQLQSDIKVATINEQLLESEIEKANNNLKDAKHLISVLRDRNIIAVPLAGQTVYPDAYAKVYWDKNSNNIYLDVQGLPTPPEGKVYQVWSLTLNPLSPTSLGTLDDFNTDANKIFTIENTNQSQAFGITLEPAGGSATPTLEQLYTLGVVETNS